MEQIDRDLESEGELVSAFREVRALEKDWQWEDRLRDITLRWKHLLPGEAGFRIVVAIAYDAPPTLFRCDANTDWRFVDVFADPVPRYQAQFTRGGKNAFAARRPRNESRALLLERLAGAIGRRPLTHREAARELRMSGNDFQRELSRLRAKLGVPIRSSSEQKIVVGIFTGWRDRFRRMTSTGPRGRKVDYVQLPVGFASYCTGHSVPALASFGVQRMRSNANGFGEMLDVVLIPRPLLVFDPPPASLEIVRFLVTLEP